MPARAYELVTLPGNVVISSREGTVVLLEDLLREAIARAREEAHKKNPALSGAQLEGVAKAVGLGAFEIPIVAREKHPTGHLRLAGRPGFQWTGGTVQYSMNMCGAIRS